VCFFAFDLLFLNGEDLRELPLIERKARLKRLLRRNRPHVLYVDHIEADGGEDGPVGATPGRMETDGLVG